MKCSYCGKEFEGSKYQERQLKQNKNVFCSKSCGTQFRYIDNYEEISDQDLVKKLINLFNTTDLSYDEIKKISGVSQSRFSNIVKKYKIKRSSEQIKQNRVNHIRETLVDKYNVTNIMQIPYYRNKIKESYASRSEEDKQKIIQQRANTKKLLYGSETYNNRDQAKQTNLNRYGVENLVQRDDIIEKRKQASLQKYGVENPFNAPEVHNLLKQKILDKYNVTSVLSLPEVQYKIKNTMLKKYGVDNIMKSVKYKKKQQNTLYDKYGVISGFLTENAINSHKCGTKSKINNDFANMLKTVTKKTIRQELPKEKYIYDILVGNDIVIDINPTITHNTYISYPYLIKVVSENKPVDKSYHLDRALNAQKYNLHLISIFDWDDVDKIKYLIQDKQTLYARNLQLKEVDMLECNKFLNNYHLQNTCKGQTIRLGLYKDDELIEIMTFGNPRYNKNYEYELLRLCTHKSYKVVGGAEKLFKHFIKQYKPQSIISYCDFSKFTGDVYSKLGFKQKNNPVPSKHWCKGHNHITDNLLRQRGYDQLFNTNYGKGTSNEQLMLENGWLPIYDCGQITFIWNKEEWL